MIGQGLSLARGLVTKHAIKQVDRMLANPGIDVDALLHHWVTFVVGKRPGITVAMDWTEFEADGQATIMLSLLCRHGRATPLVWLTVDTATLKDRRNGYEYQVLVRLAEVLPADVQVCIVAEERSGATRKQSVTRRPQSRALTDPSASKPAIGRGADVPPKHRKPANRAGKKSG